MKMTAKFVAAGVTALALAGGVTAGIASADPTTPAPGPSATASPTPGQTAKPNKPAKQDQAKKKQANKGDKKRGLLARALHGEATVGGKQTRVVAFQRGTVDQVSATEITVKSKDGFTATYRTDAKNKMKKDKKAAGVADVKAADRVRIVATKDGSTLTAKTIGDHGTK
jgi:hypothetical protein